MDFYIKVLSLPRNSLLNSVLNRPASLYYWHKEERNSNAEVDYVIQRDTTIYPIEVKSGTKGSMLSLRIFMSAKHLSKGIRTSLENFSSYENIDVYPLYAISNLLK